MQLNQVEPLGRKIAQAVVNPSRKVLATVAVHRLAWQAPARLGSDNNLFFSLFLEPRDQALAAAAAVDICGIDKIDPAIDRLMQRRHRVFIRDLAP